MGDCDGQIYTFSRLSLAIDPISFVPQGLDCKISV